MKLPRSARKINWFTLGIIGLVLLPIGAYIWATKLMDSAQAYRSPLQNTPLPPSQTLGTPITKRVVIVIIDALRYDTSTNSNVMPFLNKLRLGSAFATMHSQPPSYSVPGWTTILTGAWPDINDSQPFNPTDGSSARTFTQDGIFAAAQRAGLNTAVSGYTWFKGMLANSGVDAEFYTAGKEIRSDIEVVAAALPWLTSDYQMVLIHLDQVDYAGHHEGGPRNTAWNAAATSVDNLLSLIVGQMDLSQDTVLVISDHGQIDRGGHGGPDPVTLTEPFVLAGAGIVAGNFGDVNMVDIAPTIAALLGTNIPASNQGHVLINMLSLPSERTVAIQNALKAQQTQLLSAYIKAIGTTVTAGAGEIVSGTQTAMDQARQARLASERIWRNVLAAFLAIVPGYLLFLRKDKRVIWLMAGAILYVLFFNLRYAIIDRHTYSIASIESANWLFIYIVTTSIVAIILSWSIPMFGLRAFNAGARKAAEFSLGYIWLTIYILTLPILLTFAINGFTITWAQPEWYTMFIGLLSLIQSMVVAMVGFVLIGGSAGIGWLMRNRA
jgi:hypothetical protein